MTIYHCPIHDYSTDGCDVCEVIQRDGKIDTDDSVDSLIDGVGIISAAIGLASLVSGNHPTFLRSNQRETDDFVGGGGLFGGGGASGDF